ncbi:LysR family transcriptional regulator [Kosakonia pseudosacchari]|uniref:LysR family transcriptional regulator n=1 Tax=Kosakonia pseudosacchari TaxID=1646340 RepID=UPI00187F0AC2|nr:LysR family transcriptional regulator [Kosakonia pseudosacchari]QOV64971.1 LysR family transcriptional regulator [Kosakonia pseudosacchari]
MTLPPLQALICFHAVAQHGSMKAAAAALSISASAVSQQIAKLEAWVNVRLFMRGSRVLTLTPEGKIYLRAIQPAFHQISHATHRLIDATAHNRVSVSCSTDFAMHWLLPRLGGFERYYPHAEVLITTATRDVDLKTEGIDFAFRRTVQAGSEGILHPLENSGGMLLIYDKSALLEPLCHAFRDWLLAVAQEHHWPER